MKNTCTLHSVAFRNFTSYGKATTFLQLDTPGSALIVGEDLDHTSNGEGGNGVGKTTILAAIVYCLFDRCLDKDVKVDELINNINKKDLETVVTFTSPRGSVWRVRRYRKAGKIGNGVVLERQNEDEWEDETLDSVSNTNKKIEQVLGMDGDTFIRIVVISANSTPFLKLPVHSHYQENQTDFIERLFNLTSLSQKADVLKEQIKQTEDAIKTHTIRVEHLEGEHKRHNSQLSSMKQRVIQWEQNNRASIASLQQSLATIEGVDLERQSELYTQLKTVTDEIDAINKAQQELNRNIKAATTTSTKLTTELKHLHEAKCPYCLQSFADAASKIEANEAKLAELSETLRVLTEDIDRKAGVRAKLEDQETQIRDEITVSNIQELLKVKNQKETIMQRLTELENTTNPFLEPLEELETIQLDPIDHSELNRLKKYQEHQNMVLKLLTKKDSFVRKALLTGNLPYLNNNLQKYLSELGLSHKVEFTHEMTANITQFGRPLGFGNLSNGQKARVNLALAWAFRDVVQRMHCAVNLCMLDEVLDVGLDDIGVQAAARMLKRKARDEGISLYVISHRNEVDGIFDRTITVQMSDGFSYIKDGTD